MKKISEEKFNETIGNIQSTFSEHIGEGSCTRHGKSAHLVERRCPVCGGIMPMAKIYKHKEDIEVLRIYSPTIYWEYCYDITYRCLGCLKLFKKIEKPSEELEEVI